MRYLSTLSTTKPLKRTQPPLRQGHRAVSTLIILEVSPQPSYLSLMGTMTVLEKSIQ